MFLIVQVTQIPKRLEFPRMVPLNLFCFQDSMLLILEKWHQPKWNSESYIQEGSPSTCFVFPEECKQLVAFCARGQKSFVASICISYHPICPTGTGQRFRDFTKRHPLYFSDFHTSYHHIFIISKFVVVQMILNNS